MYRCLNDIFGYCTETPGAVTTYRPEANFDMAGKYTVREVPVSRCSLDPATCGKHRTFTQVLAVTNVSMP